MKLSIMLPPVARVNPIRVMTDSDTPVEVVMDGEAVSTSGDDVVTRTPPFLKWGRSKKQSKIVAGVPKRKRRFGPPQPGMPPQVGTITDPSGEEIPVFPKRGERRGHALARVMARHRR